MTSQDENFQYELIPQTPSVDAAECTVTINFPDMLLVNEDIHLPPRYTTQQQQNGPREHAIHVPSLDWDHFPNKLRPPPFRVHRCHHEGMERGGEGDQFELPNGFPEAVQQMCQVPDNVSESSN